MRKGETLLFLFLFLFSISFTIVSAQETNGATDDSDFIDQRNFDCGDFPCDYFDDEGNYIGPSGVDFDKDVRLEVSAGTTPDSPFYFLDDFFDRFGDELEVREEKIAEIRVMIQEGKIEDARKALVRYRFYADVLEQEIDPAKRDEARRSASAIRNALLALEAEIPEDARREFVDDVIEQEEAIVTAVEIASRIKELCETLAELDPLEYSRTCRTNEDSPEWHQRLDRDLTDAQRQEAEAFFEIMSECFETSGGQCRCEDITITAFAEKCSIIAPLAYACDVEDNEGACDQMDEIEDEEPIEDLLPDYLREVLFRLEDRYDDSQFENHAPRECREAGVTTRVECMRLMFSLNAPEECVQALNDGRINLDMGEREMREACEAIMFDLEAPFECIEAGLTDFRECGILMFQLNAPQECIDAGLTGEHRSDERKCRELVGGEFGPGERGPRGFAFGVHCGQILNPQERLACFDAAASEAQFNQFDRSGPNRGPEDFDWPGPCQEAEAFTRELCEQVMEEWGERQRELDRLEREQEHFEESPPECFDDQELYCTDDGVCECVDIQTEPEPTPEEKCATDGGTWNGSTTTCVFPEPPATGAVISGNAFLEYYYG